MKIIFKITRTELQNLFYSPVPWFLAVIFLMQCAYFYFAAITPNVHLQNWSILNNPGFKSFSDLYSITNIVFFSEDSIVIHVYQNLYLFIPLLTMGVISREINSGTIKLLYSSPIKLRQIILGKYLAVMAFILVLISILAFFMVLGAFHIKAVDYGHFLSALLGLTLLAGAYSAIGLFMSSLSNYQIVSGIATFALFFILGRIGGLFQKYDFVRDLTWFLSLAGRTEQMLAGLITTRDVIYFVVIIIMFLSFTLFKLTGEQESKPWTIKAGRYASVIVISLLFGYVTSRPRLVGYFDATAENVNTIAPAMQEIMKKMGKEPLEITLYGNLFGNGLADGLPEARNQYLYSFWDKYLRFKPDITFKYVYYYDNDRIQGMYPNKTMKEISGIVARQWMRDSAMYIPPSEIRKQMDPYKEELNLFMTAKFKGDTVNLRTYGGPYPWPFQKEMASKFKRLIERKGPKVYFLTGSLQRSIYKTGEREYSFHTIKKGDRESLVNLAFDVDTLSLETQDIPANTTALVLADPRTELGSTTRKKLEQYIARGGNLMVLGEPGKQAIINPILQQMGIQQLKGQLVQTSENETPDKITPYMLKSSLELIQQSEVRKKQQLEDKSSYSGAVLSMVGAAALSYDTIGPFTIKPILKTLPDEAKAVSTKMLSSGIELTPTQKSVKTPIQRQTWLKMSPLVTDSVPPVFNPQDGDVKNPSYITAAYLTRQVNNRQQRAIVLGDADILSNMRWEKVAIGNHFYNWFDYGEHPVYIPRAYHKDILFLITEPALKILKIICQWVLPGLLLLAGIILLIRRKRK